MGQSLLASMILKNNHSEMSNLGLLIAMTTVFGYISMTTTIDCREDAQRLY